jgi:UPF0148 protein
MGEQDLEKITKMLEKGGTMLAKHCECGAPLFKYQGKILCPVCESKETVSQGSTGLAVPVETRPTVAPQPSLQSVSENRLIEIPQRQVSLVMSDKGLDAEAIETVLIIKINDIASRLAREEYPDKIQMYLDIIESSLKIIKELRSLSK